MRVAVVGAAGRMGRLVVGAILDAPDLHLAAAFGREGAAASGSDAGTLCGRAPAGVSLRPVGDVVADVWVDFSLPAGLDLALNHIRPGVPLVTGTTGLDARLRDRLDATAATRPLVAAANFSTGVALLRSLARIAASTLPSADVEIIETHHRHKRDAPSGTALALASDVAASRGVDLASVIDHGRHGETGPRAEGRIGMHALRGGDINGDHTVWLAMDGETVSLSHRATARSTFAMGALRAARWLVGRPPGRYTMDDVLGLGAVGAEDAFTRS